MPESSFPSRSWTWPARRIRRRLWHGFCGAIYQDRDRDPGHTLLLAGTARSGTTWLADVLAAGQRARVMFEPFHPGKVAAYRGHEYFHYLRPADDDPQLREFCESLFTGRIRNRWIDRQVTYVRPRGRVIKEIRANLFLKWIQTHFPRVPLLLVTRHPCAVVLSRLQLDWDTDEDIRSFLAQPRLLEDHLGPYLPVIERASTPEEKHAVIWCVHHLVPLRQFEADELPMVYYEDLCLRPQEELERLGRAVGWTFAATGMLDQPSRTATPQSAVVRGEDRVNAWQRRLEPAQIDRVLAVVRGFGLEGLYGPDALPHRS